MPALDATLDIAYHAMTTGRRLPRLEPILLQQAEARLAELEAVQLRDHVSRVKAACLRQMLGKDASGLPSPEANRDWPPNLSSVSAARVPTEEPSDAGAREDRT